MALRVVEALALFYLPGALILRLPGATHAYRAGLPAEERVFWSVVLSLVWSLGLVLALGLAGHYEFNRLLLINGVASGLTLVFGRRRLLFPKATAARVSWPAAIPIGLVIIGCWLYFPPAEYIIGGKDPGTYINEGVQLAQRGEIVIHDRLVASVPDVFRNLFFPSYGQSTYYGLRFMGFFLQDPATGAVVGQFPHLYPASIALGYGLNGLSGARQAIGVWALLGLAAVYFAGTRIVGRAAAAAAATLLAINVVEVWFARYPNSELPMQALLFAALLAANRSRSGGGAFFGAVAGLLLGFTLFLRYEIFIAIGAFAAAAVLAPVTRQRLGKAFAGALLVSTAAGVLYLSGPMRAYFDYPLGFVRDRGGWLLVLGIVAVAIGTWRLLRISTLNTVVHRWGPPALGLIVGALAVYAYFFRQVGGTTAEGDAMAFRTFGWYLTPPWALALAVIGATVLIATRCWEDPTFYLTFVTFSVFFFYKTRIVPEHFWTSRRFLGMALPGALLLMTGAISAAAGALRLSRPTRRWATLASVVLVAVVSTPIGISFWRAAAPVRAHIEYAGLIPHLEQLAARIGDRDLLIVEARQASDLHVFGMPLAYTYGRNVLWLSSAAPSKRLFENFVAWARSKYDNVYFLGGGGTDLLTRRVSAAPVSSDRFQVPEYDAPINAYPSGPRQKEFEFGLYRLVDVEPREPGPIDLPIGTSDDLNVVRFHAKEKRPDSDASFRWTQWQSFVLLLGIAPDASELAIWMSSGGRPEKAPPATVEVAIEEPARNITTVLGTATPVDEVRPFTFALPRELVQRLATTQDPVRVRLRVQTWNPAEALGVDDSRDLGVMVTRVTVH